MKTYYWPLVLIGGTLIVMGAALPWFRWSGGGFITLGQPTSGYISGFESLCGLPVAAGGVILLGMALSRQGEPESRSYPLIASLVCALLIAGAAWLVITPMPIEGQSTLPAFGLWVSLLGVALCMVGGLIPVSEAVMASRTSIAILAAFEFSILIVGLVLITRPGVGAQLGVWQIPERLPSRLCLAGAEAHTTQEAACIATLTAEAARWTAAPPALWPWDQSVPYRLAKMPAHAPTAALQDIAAHPESYRGKWVEIRDAPILHVYCPTQFTIGTQSASVYLVLSSRGSLSFQEGDNVSLIRGMVGGDCKRQYPGKAIICGLLWAQGRVIMRPPPSGWQVCPP